MSIFHEIDVYGKHILEKFNTITDETHRGTDDKGRMLYTEDDDAVWYGTTTSWIKLPGIYDIFPQNTKVLMASYPLPDNFNIDLTASWDGMMILFTETLGDVGTVPTEGSWTISGISEEGKHYHGNKTGYPTETAQLGESEIDDKVAPDNHRHNIEYNSLHFHSFDGSWRPVNTQYLVVEYQ